MTTIFSRRYRGVELALLIATLACQSALGAVKQRVYTLGDNDPGAVVGSAATTLTSVTPNRPGTNDILASTTDLGGVAGGPNISLVPLAATNASLSPIYALANDRPGAVAGNLALVFDGVNDSLRSVNPANSAQGFAFDPRNFDGNFETLTQAWVKPTATYPTAAQQFIFRVGAENGAARISPTGFWSMQVGNTISVDPVQNDVVDSTLAVVPNQWAHVAVLRGGNASRMYVNGRVVATRTDFWGGIGTEVRLGAQLNGVNSYFQGAIDNFNIGTLSNGFNEAVDVDYWTDIGVTFSGITGDVNQDGLVNLSDYQVWSQNFGFNNGLKVGDLGTLVLGDVDRSGRIDLYDFRIIQKAALGVPGFPAGLPVPEPGSIVLLIAGSALLVHLMRLRRLSHSQPALAWAAAAVVLTATIASADRAEAVVIAAEDFLYDGPSHPEGPGGGFGGDERYAGGHNGAAGKWTSLWGSLGDGIIVTSAYVPRDIVNNPSEATTPRNVAFWGGKFSGQDELYRNFRLDASIPLTQTLYFGARIKVDLAVKSELGESPTLWSPRIFLNRIAGNDNAVEPDPVRDRTKDIALGFENDMLVARLGAGPETMSPVVTAPPNDGNWHNLVGKLQLNVAGANERLTVWLDPTGVETGGVTAQIEADILTDLSGLIGTFHTQGAVPRMPAVSSLGRSYMDDVALGTAWQDVTTVNVPRLTLRINPTTGAGKIINASSSSLALDGYSIESATGSLSVAGWNSLDDQNVGSWLQNAATANQLVESNFFGASTLAPGAQLSLGNIFTTSGMQDIVGRNTTSDGLVNLLKVEYSTAGLLGDYDGNSRVDGGDFLLWQRTLGTNVSPGSGADGDNNGVVGAGDLGVWRTNFGQTATTAAAAAIPEPLATSLAGAAALTLLMRRRRGVHR